MICEGNNFLRDHSAVIVIREVKPIFDLDIQCFTGLVDEVAKVGIRIQHQHSAKSWPRTNQPLGSTLS